MRYFINQAPLCRDRAIGHCSRVRINMQSAIYINFFHFKIQTLIFQQKQILQKAG